MIELEMSSSIELQFVFNKAIAYTLKNSMKELGLLVFLITISGLIFASFTYFIEDPDDSGNIMTKLGHLCDKKPSHVLLYFQNFKHD